MYVRTWLYANEGLYCVRYYLMSEQHSTGLIVRRCDSEGEALWTTTNLLINSKYKQYQSVEVYMPCLLSFIDLRPD